MRENCFGMPSHAAAAEEVEPSGSFESAVWELDTPTNTKFDDDHDEIYTI